VETPQIKTFSPVLPVARAPPGAGSAVEALFKRGKIEIGDGKRCRLED
jgi:hypothetical protein